MFCKTYEPGADLKVIVVTDGERLLGLGGQAVGGVSAFQSVTSSYTACGGMAQAYTLPGGAG
ncbi:hypothetical protein ACLK19_10075 [Escherichia coli]